MMKMLLMSMPYNIDKKTIGELSPPYGLACVSSFLKSKGCDVTLFDACAYGFDRRKMIEYAKDANPDLIGFTAITCNVNMIASLCHDIKQELPNIKIILGGPHPTVEPNSTLQNYLDVDIVVIGEGEYTCLDLIFALENSISLSTVKGIAYRDEDGTIVLNEIREPIQNLDELPFADWESLPIEKYFTLTTEKKNTIRTLASRGCPFNCTFCAVKTSIGKTVRQRSPENVVAELIHLYEMHGVRDVVFGDSTMNLDAEWLSKFCNLMIEMNKTKKIIWRCNVRANTTTEVLARLMKESGCRQVFMGVESGSEYMLRRMKKGETLNDIKNAVNVYNKVGLRIFCSFILGMPGETLQTIQETLDFANSINIFSGGFSLATPLPGTEFYEIAKKEGEVIRDITKYNAKEVSYVPRGMTKEQLLKEYKRINKQFFFKPTRLIKNLLGMTTIFSLKVHLLFSMRLLKEKIFQGEQQ